MTDPGDKQRGDRWAVPVQRPPLYPLLSFVARPLLRLTVRVLGGLAVEGREHIPPTGAVLIVANHVSYADPPLIAMACPRPVWFMANQPIFEMPLLKWLVPQCLAFPVARDVAVDRTALRRSEAILDSGEALCIFPEGGTTPDARLARFYSGAGLLALRTGCVVIPAGMIGTHRLMPNLTWVPRYARGGVQVRFGPPLSFADMPGLPGRREQADWVSARMWEGIAALLPEEHLPPEPLMSTQAAPGSAN